MRPPLVPTLAAVATTAVLAATVAGPAGALAPAGPATSAVGSPVAPQPGFRILPYLQSPAADAMTVVWVGELDSPGTLTVRGPASGPAP